MPEQVAFICVQVESRDGAFYASSKDLPGLHLCGHSMADVQKDVGPMIQRMYELNSGLQVRVAAAADAKSFKVPATPPGVDHLTFWASPVREALTA